MVAILHTLKLHSRFWFSMLCSSKGRDANTQNQSQSFSLGEHVSVSVCTCLISTWGCCLPLRRSGSENMQSSSDLAWAGKVDSAEQVAEEQQDDMGNNGNTLLTCERMGIYCDEHPKSWITCLKKRLESSVCSLLRGPPFLRIGFSSVCCHNRKTVALKSFSGLLWATWGQAAVL